MIPDGPGAKHLGETILEKDLMTPRMWAGRNVSVPEEGRGIINSKCITPSVPPPCRQPGANLRGFWLMRLGDVCTQQGRTVIGFKGHLPIGQRCRAGARAWSWDALLFLSSKALVHFLHVHKSLLIHPTSPPWTPQHFTGHFYRQLCNTIRRYPGLLLTPL